MVFWVRCPIIFSVLFSRSGNLSFLDSNPINRNCWQWAICMHCATHGCKQQCGWLSIMLLAEPLLWKLFFIDRHCPFSAGTFHFLSFLVFPPNKSFKQLFHSALLHGENVNCSGNLKNENFFLLSIPTIQLFNAHRKSHCLYNSAIRDLNNISGKGFI